MFYGDPSINMLRASKQQHFSEVFLSYTIDSGIDFQEMECFVFAGGRLCLYSY